MVAMEVDGGEAMAVAAMAMAAAEMGLEAEAVTGRGVESEAVALRAEREVERRRGQCRTPCGMQMALPPQRGSPASWPER